MTFAAAALLLLLAVPHQPFWQDFELARRGVLLCLVAALSVAPGLTVPRRSPTTLLPLALLIVWVGVWVLAAPAPHHALESLVYLAALVLLLSFGTRIGITSLLTASLPTSLVVAGHTLLQSKGLLLPPDPPEGGAIQFVASLGNLNVASEVLAVGGALAALLITRDDASMRRKAFATGTLGACAAAVVVNTSLSGLIALPLGCLPCLFRRGRVRVGLALLLGLGLGFASRSTAPVKQPDPPGAAQDATVQAPSTIDVRIEMWKGCLGMVADEPLRGHGIGQFPFVYPRYRTQREIELTTFGRRFETSPVTAHNDYLQLLAEGGAPALLLLLWFAVAVLRRAPWYAWGSLLSFAFLAGVRAPIFNAPAAAMFFLFAGTLIGANPGRLSRETPKVMSTALGILVALCLAYLGSAQLLSQIASTGFVEQMRTKQDWNVAFRSIRRVLDHRPWDVNFRMELAKAYLKQKETLGKAREELAYLKEIAGARADVQFHYALLCSAEGRTDEAIDALTALLNQDPHDLRAIQVYALILTRKPYAEAQGPQLAVALLYRETHPRMRKALARTLGSLVPEAADQAGRDFLTMEQRFIETLDAIAADEDGAPAVRSWQDFAKAQRQVRELAGKDMRVLVLNAAIMLALGKRDNAIAVAELARDRTLDPDHAALMRNAIAGLREIPQWREILDRATAE